VVLFLALDPPTDDSDLMMVHRPCALGPVDSIHGIIDPVHAFALREINLKIIEIP
jgi:hypothetical protein